MRARAREKKLKFNIYIKKSYIEKETREEIINTMNIIFKLFVTVGGRVAITMSATKTQEKGGELVVSFLFGARGCKGEAPGPLECYESPSRSSK